MSALAPSFGVVTLACMCPSPWRSLASTGADAVAGLHSDPSYSFTEEFQSE